MNYFVYWGIIIALMMAGIIKIFFVKGRNEKGNRRITEISMTLSILGVLYLALAREAYAVVILFVLLVIKVILMFGYRA